MSMGILVGADNLSVLGLDKCINVTLGEFLSWELSGYFRYVLFLEILLNATKRLNYFLLVKEKTKSSPSLSLPHQI